MKASKILRDAAQLIEEYRALYGCQALIRAIGDSPFDRKYIHNINGELHYKWEDDAPKGAMDYFKLLRPKRASQYGWFGRPYDDSNRDWRILALCFAAAIAESEGN